MNEGCVETSSNDDLNSCLASNRAVDVINLGENVCGSLSTYQQVFSDDSVRNKTDIDNFVFEYQGGEITITLKVPKFDEDLPLQLKLRRTLSISFPCTGSTELSTNSTEDVEVLSDGSAVYKLTGLVSSGVYRITISFESEGNGNLHENPSIYPCDDGLDYELNVTEEVSVNPPV